MADVTISQLPTGSPSGGHLLPYSNNNTTLATPVSSMFTSVQNLLIGGNISFSEDLKEYFIKCSANSGAIRFRSNSATGTDRRLQLGIIDNNGTWSSIMTVAEGGINVQGVVVANLANFTDCPIRFFNVIDNSSFGGSATGQSRIGTLTLTKKSLCIFTWSATAYRLSAGTIIATLSIDGIGNLQQTNWYTNETSSHKSSPGKQISYTLNPGTYTIRITVDQMTDVNDYANCGVIAIASE